MTESGQEDLAGQVDDPLPGGAAGSRPGLRQIDEGPVLVRAREDGERLRARGPEGTRRPGDLRSGRQAPRPRPSTIRPRPHPPTVAWIISTIRSPTRRDHRDRELAVLDDAGDGPDIAQPAARDPLDEAEIPARPRHELERRSPGERAIRTSRTRSIRSSGSTPRDGVGDRAPALASAVSGAGERSATLPGPDSRARPNAVPMIATRAMATTTPAALRSVRRRDRGPGTSNKIVEPGRAHPRDSAAPARSLRGEPPRGPRSRGRRPRSSSSAATARAGSSPAPGSPAAPRPRSSAA